jgi:adenylylsulfate kinase
MSVAWITGLSGSGKTTLARRVVAHLREGGRPVAHLDGDDLRAAIDDRHARYDLAGRRINAWRISRLAQLLERQGLVVVVSTVSLFHEIHRWNRRHLPGYVEIFLDVDLAVLIRRDPKGIYAGAPRVMGMDLVPETPEVPDLVLRNDFTSGAADRACQQIVGLLRPTAAASR